MVAIRNIFKNVSIQIIGNWVNVMVFLSFGLSLV